MHSVTTAKVN